MGNYQLEYGALNELAEEFIKMDDNLKSNIKEVATEIGEQLKRNTEAAIPRASKPTHGVHLADDVKLNVKATEKKATITVSGGKKTGSLWFIVDNGHIAQNGRFVGGAHFTDKAYRATDVETPVNRFIQEILHE